jgi:tRNA modification GTPase
MNSGPTITRLTPPGAAAIAALELRGEHLWPVLRAVLRRPNGKELPDKASVGNLYLTRVEELGEEVVLVCRQAEPVQVVELHSHGGEQLIRWLVEYFAEHGLTETTREQGEFSVARAETLRIARILLDQSMGAFRKKIESLVAALEQERWADIDHALHRLKCLIPAAEHLTRPFQLAIVGAPNVGKSSLVNTLLGYQRSVVSPSPGTTRDTVTTRLSLDGWMVDLTDTAGLREAFDPLEAEGIERAESLLQGIDLCLWILDSTGHPYGPTVRMIERVKLSRESLLFVLNKCDRSATWDLREIPQAVRVSATTGMGIKALCDRIVSRLLPAQPVPGEAVPLRPATHRLLHEAVGYVQRRSAAALSQTLTKLLTSEEVGP